MRISAWTVRYSALNGPQNGRKFFPLVQKETVSASGKSEERQVNGYVC